jgi:hypothetical protein
MAYREGGDSPLQGLTLKQDKETMAKPVIRMFVEWHHYPEEVRYTLKDEDGDYPSLYKLYMEMEDVTEWEFAKAHIGSYDTWTKLCAAGWFKETIARWRKELELKLKARHLREVKAIADKGGKDALTANKYLLDKGYVVAEQPKRGRPTKNEIAEKADALARFDSETKEDLERIRTLN